MDHDHDEKEIRHIEAPDIDECVEFDAASLHLWELLGLGALQSSSSWQGFLRMLIECVIQQKRKKPTWKMSRNRLSHFSIGEF